MSPSRFLLLAASWGWSLTAAVSTKTILWPEEFSGYEYQVASSLYDVRTVNETTWGEMTTAEFAAYDAIAIPDNGVCDQSEISFAVSNRETWSNAVGGAIFVIGTSLQNNVATAYSESVLQNALGFVTSGTTTGLFVSLGCYYVAETSPQYVEVMGGFGDLSSQSPYIGLGGCSSSVHVMSTAVALAGMTDESLYSDWNCSAAEVYTMYIPEDNGNWFAEAIVTDATATASQGYTSDRASDPPASGIPYIVSRAAISTGCGNGIYEPNYGEECDNSGASDPICNSDCKCSYGQLDANEGTCNPEPVCGNGIIEGDEACDSGATNGRLDDPCTATCQCANVDENGPCVVVADVCGNGIWEYGYETSQEECDRGPDGDAVCDASCQCIYGPNDIGGACNSEPVCGDGNIQGVEQCEREVIYVRDLTLGKRISFWGGDATCTAECQCRYGLNSTTEDCNPVPVCGNDVQEVGEECDAGQEGDALCSPACTCIYGIDSETEACDAAPEAPETCGDGALDSETEQCDPAIVGDDLCSSSCTCIYGVDTEGEAGSCLSRPTCGNGILDDDEECDPYTLTKRAPINNLCSSICTCIYGYNATARSCNPVPVCNNGILEMGEECDAGTETHTICSADCTCIYGMTEERTCILPPASTTTSSTASSTSSVSVKTFSGSDIPPTTTSVSPPLTTPFSNSTTTQQWFSSTEQLTEQATQQATEQPTEQSTEQPTEQSTEQPSASVPLPSESVGSSASAGASSTADPLPATVGVFSFVGCTGSDENYPSFSLELSSSEMDLEMCTTACSDHLYAGVHTTNCYCADNFDTVVTVAKDLCSTPCPGNPEEHCGGFRDVSRLARRQATVPDNALLAIYINPAAAPASSVTISTTTSSTATALVDPGVGRTTTALTTVAVATGTVTAPRPGGSTTMTVCVGGYCNSGGYIFEICTGTPAVGEIVFVMEPCTCHGGFSYVPANCTGEACAGETVYKCVPFTGPVGTTVVYEPEPCDHCAGGVTFVPSGGESSAVVSPTTMTVVPSGGESTGQATGPATITSTLVAVAGASKVFAYSSSVLLVVGAFAIML